MMSIDTKQLSVEPSVASSIITSPSASNFSNKSSNKQCSICGLVTKSPFHLKEHTMIHTGIKKFSCPYCPYACIKSSRFKSHIRKHTGEKPYACPYCNHTSAERGNLTKHVQIMHNRALNYTL